MSKIQTFEDLIKDQLNKVNQLDTATNFILNKKSIKDDLFDLTKDLNNVKLGLGTVKKDLDRMKEQNIACKNLIDSYDGLNDRVKYFEGNIPSALLQAIQHPNALIQSSKATQLEIRKMNGTTPATIKSSNVYRNTKPDVVDAENMNISEFYLQTQDCRKTLFKDDNEEPYIVKHLSEAEFLKIPKYMIGRQSIACVNDFISTINQVLKCKYSLITMGKIGARKKGELELYLQFIKEQTDVCLDGDKKYFFTSEDYYRETKQKLDKAKLNMLTGLRHSKRIQELRNGKIIRYEVILN